MNRGSRTVLVTGSRGLLGAAIAREFQAPGLVTLDHQRLDITDAAAVTDIATRLRPDLIINCAAYNDVDGAESSAARALEVNAFAVLTLAEAARQSGATLVHYSSDFVFDGETDRPYTEEDTPRPRSVYAASKLLGDWFALDAPRAYVLRVESLFGEPGPDATRRGSLGTIVQKIRDGAEVPVFVDRTVSPSYTADIARATRAIVERGLPSGIYHCVNTGYATWLEIAQEAAAIVGKPLHATPLTLDTVALAARRPRYCALSNARLAAAGIQMPTWQDALRRSLTRS